MTARSPTCSSSGPNPLRRFQLAAEGEGIHQPPDHLRARLQAVMDPLPIWYAPLMDAVSDAGDYPLHALTQRPMAMYHSWGSQNAWLRQIHGVNPLYLPTGVWEQGGFSDGDWARVTSAAWRDHRAGGAYGRAEPAYRLDLERHRQAARRLGAVARGARGDRGVPAEPPDPRQPAAAQRWRRQSNSDPITGQAAWFDLRVRVERVCGPSGRQPARVPAPRLAGAARPRDAGLRRVLRMPWPNATGQRRPSGRRSGP